MPTENSGTSDQTSTAHQYDDREGPETAQVAKEKGAVVGEAVARTAHQRPTIVILLNILALHKSNICVYTQLNAGGSERAPPFLLTGRWVGTCEGRSPLKNYFEPLS